MKKSGTVYACRSCGSSSPRWSGQCRACGEWNTLVEEARVRDEAKGRGARRPAAGSLIQLKDISTDADTRISTGIAELDRVLGGGIVPSSIILVGGDPGIGKSTLMLQMCAFLATERPLYITGEESPGQIKFRAQRLKGVPENLLLLSETNVERIIAAMDRADAGVVIVDSIQTMYRDDIESAPGSVAQVRECAALLMQTAKTSGAPIFLVGHVTKEGAIAGPRVLEHIVDTVLQFEGERLYAYRILRAVKNRYGSTNELGVFEMGEDGLREVRNPSELFLSERNSGESGAAVVAAIEGTRPMLVEVQALVTPSSYGVPQRSATGYDYKRLQMILAVLEKRLGLRLGQHDVFVNIAGGIRLDDPAVDLGVAAAVVSSLRDIPVPVDTVLIGEIGLSGEVRAVSNVGSRLNEIEKLGFAAVVFPAANARRLPERQGLELLAVDRIVKALVGLFKGTPVSGGAEGRQ